MNTFLGFGALIASVIGVQFWRSVAPRFGFVAIPNQRTMHSGAVPVGGGIVFALIWLALLSVMYGLGQVSSTVFLALFGGGAALALLGVVDDIKNLSATMKFGSQIGVALWGLYWVGDMPNLAILSNTFDLGILASVLGGLMILWMCNLFNFTDGIDGFLASGSVFIGATMAVILHLEQMYVYSMMLYLLTIAVMGFLWFNWPPAKLFMGDAGSLFLGYILCILMFITCKENPTLLWVWLIVMGYFLVDTTSTLVLRILFRPPFYEPHRDHAYQTLAGRWGSHLRVTGLVLCIKIVWLLPLAFVAYRFPEYGSLVFLIAIVPITVFCANKGVLYHLRAQKQAPAQA
ncbi:MAG: glycosyltransferase family 4 protein [Pseudomonadota bacterium]